MCHSQLYLAALVMPTGYVIWQDPKPFYAFRLRTQPVGDPEAVRLIGPKARLANQSAVCPSQVHVVTFTRRRLLPVRERAYGLDDTVG